MKRAYLKNVFRTILNNKRRYISILLIVALGTAFFVGLRSTSPDMNLMIDNYFDDQNMYDIRVVTNLGIDAEDLEAIALPDGVTAVMPAYYCDEFIQVRESSSLARFHSLNMDEIYNNTALNIPVLIQGRYPKNGDECLLDDRYFKITGCEIGDYISVSTGNDSDIYDDIAFDTYKIVGTVESPLYVTDSVGTTSKGRGFVNTFVYISEKSFNFDIYTEAYVMTDTADLSRFSDEYEDIVSEVAANIEIAVDNSLNARHKNLIDEGEAKIADGKKEIEDGRKKLSNALDELNRHQADIEQGKLELNEHKTEFYRQKAEFEAGFLMYGDISQLPPDMIYMYNAGLVEFDEQEKILISAVQDLEAAEDELQDAFSEYEKQKQESEEKFFDAENEIAENEGKLDDLKKISPESYVLDLNTNIGFVSFDGDSDRINAIGYVFPSIFFLVAALVTLTNMMRIVEDDRSAVGVLKSLGYSKYHIFAKYLTYAVLVAIPGVLLGVLVGYNLFPSAIYNMGYKILYTTPKITAVIHPDICLLAGIVAFISIVIPTIYVCYGEVVSTPANLIRPKAPHTGRRIILERIPFLWNRLNFFAKVTARNLLRYKKRFFMTVAGVAGCTALIVTGFGIMDSIKYIPVKQFENIFLYDGSINLKDDISEGEKSAIEEVLRSRNNEWLYTYNKTINIENNGKTEEIAIAVPQDMNKVTDFFVFNNRGEGEKNKKLYFENGGVILTEKICSLLNYKTGDTVTLIADNKKVTAKLLGICENYVNNYVYMTVQTYGELFGVEYSDMEYNSILCKADDNSEEKEESLSTELLTLDGVSGLSFNTRTINFYSDMINSLNFVVIILVLSAAALAFIVLFSLTAINIDERMRELATLKVLGFYNGETSQYIFRENFILTMIGTIAGLILGIVLHRYVISTVEIDIIMFSRDILPASFIYSAVLTLLFSLTVNFFMGFSIRKINMVESLKSVE